VGLFLVRLCAFSCASYLIYAFIAFGFIATASSDVFAQATPSIPPAAPATAPPGNVNDPLTKDLIDQIKKLTTSLNQPTTNSDLIAALQSLEKAIGFIDCSASSTLQPCLATVESSIGKLGTAATKALTNDEGTRVKALINKLVNLVATDPSKSTTTTSGTTATPPAPDPTLAATLVATILADRINDKNALPKLDDSKLNEALRVRFKT
jgi:hypothetical protein